MPSDAWAQAVEAMEAVLIRCRHMGHCDCVSDGFRAALPHLLRAVVEGMESVAPEAPDEVEIAGRFISRTALLAALTDAAERVAK